MCLAITGLNPCGLRRILSLMKCRTDKTAAGPASDEALLREWLEAVRSDIESAVPSDAVRERSSGGYAESAPICHVVAGANGSGKTTFALHFLPRYVACLEFVNPDLIAGGLKNGGYRIHLYYVWVPDVGILTARIHQRVTAGGHFVPDADVIRRRERSIRLMKEYAALADKLRVFDNSGPAPILVYEKNGDAVIHDAKRFEQVNREVGL